MQILYRLVWEKTESIKGGYKGNDNDMVCDRMHTGLFVGLIQLPNWCISCGGCVTKPLAVSLDNQWRWARFSLPGVWGKKLVRFSPTKFWVLAPQHTYLFVIVAL
jgi:hypothetical protein